VAQVPVVLVVLRPLRQQMVQFLYLHQSLPLAADEEVVMTAVGTPLILEAQEAAGLMPSSQMVLLAQQDKETLAAMGSNFLLMLVAVGAVLEVLALMQVVLVATEVLAH
jgi:hypothetical protein